MILRRLIETENKEEDAFKNHTPCYEWDSDSWDDYREEVKKRQI